MSFLYLWALSVVCRPESLLVKWVAIQMWLVNIGGKSNNELFCSIENGQETQTRGIHEYVNMWQLQDRVITFECSSSEFPSVLPSSRIPKAIPFPTQLSIWDIPKHHLGLLCSVIMFHPRCLFFCLYVVLYRLHSYIVGFLSLLVVLWYLHKYSQSKTQLCY